MARHKGLLLSMCCHPTGILQQSLHSVWVFYYLCVVTLQVQFSSRLIRSAFSTISVLSPYRYTSAVASFGLGLLLSLCCHLTGIVQQSLHSVWVFYYLCVVTLQVYFSSRFIRSGSSTISVLSPYRYTSAVASFGLGFLLSLCSHPTGILQQSLHPVWVFYCLCVVTLQVYFSSRFIRSGFSTISVLSPYRYSSAVASFGLGFLLSLCCHPTGILQQSLHLVWVFYNLCVVTLQAQFSSRFIRSGFSTISVLSPYRYSSAVASLGLGFLLSLYCHPTDIVQQSLHAV